VVKAVNSDGVALKGVNVTMSLLGECRFVDERGAIRSSELIRTGPDGIAAFVCRGRFEGCRIQSYDPMYMLDREFYILTFPMEPVPVAFPKRPMNGVIPCLIEGADGLVSVIPEMERRAKGKLYSAEYKLLGPKDELGRHRRWYWMLVGSDARIVGLADGDYHLVHLNLAFSKAERRGARLYPRDGHFKIHNGKVVPEGLKMVFEEKPAEQQ
jgi:hypothetical protein